MGWIKFVLAATCAVSCATAALAADSTRPRVQRDVEGYAIATCLTYQAEPYLRGQGDGWASAIVQGGKGDINVLARLAARVKQELPKVPMAVIPSESGVGHDTTLPILYCHELIDRPAVRAAIRQAIAALAPAYRR